MNSFILGSFAMLSLTPIRVLVLIASEKTESPKIVWFNLFILLSCFVLLAWELRPFIDDLEEELRIATLFVASGCGESVIETRVGSCTENHYLLMFTAEPLRNPMFYWRDSR